MTARAPVASPVTGTPAVSSVEVMPSSPTTNTGRSSGPSRRTAAMGEVHISSAVTSTPVSSEIRSAAFSGERVELLVTKSSRAPASRSRRSASGTPGSTRLPR
jgi:hypothetical protein